jgi:hypothetical protein
MFKVVIHGILNRSIAEAFVRQIEGGGLPASMHVSIEEDSEDHDIEDPAGDPPGDD